MLKVLFADLNTALNCQTPRVPPVPEVHYVLLTPQDVLENIRNFTEEESLWFTTEGRQPQKKYWSKTNGNQFQIRQKLTINSRISNPVLCGYVEEEPAGSSIYWWIQPKDEIFQVYAFSKFLGKVFVSIVLLLFVTAAFNGRIAIQEIATLLGLLAMVTIIMAFGRQMIEVHPEDAQTLRQFFLGLFDISY
jgi:hypothetical protein